MSGPCHEKAAEAAGHQRGSALARNLTQARGALLLPAALPVGLHLHTKEEGRSLLQRSPQDPTLISVLCIYNISPTRPIHLWAFSFSHTN